MKKRGKYVDWIARTDTFEMIVGSVMAHRSINRAVESLRNNPVAPKIMQNLHAVL